MIIASFDDIVSVKIWLWKNSEDFKKLKNEKWIQTMFVNLMKNAVDWAFNETDVMTIIEKKIFSAEDKTMFLKLFEKKYFMKKQFTKFSKKKLVEIQIIQQSKTKFFKKYYERVDKLFLTTKNRDVEKNDESLNMFEKLVVVLIIERFIIDFRNNKLRSKTSFKYLQKTKIDDKSMKNVWNCVKKCLIFLKSKKIVE